MITTVTQKNMVSIPAEVWRKYGIRPGYKLDWQPVEGTDEIRVRVIPDRAAAIRYALGQARPGDTVLIAGRGDRQTRLAGTKAPPYDDREIASAWLYDRDQPQLAAPRFRVVG